MDAGRGTRQGFKWRWANVDQSGRTDEYVSLLNRLHVDDDPARYLTTMPWINAQPGELILEVGCGNGAVSRAVARHVPTLRGLVATDASRAMIAAAQNHLRRRNIPVEFVVADAHQLPFPDASFDRCFTMETLVVIDDPQLALAELMRVVRPGGVLCVRESDPDASVTLGTNVALMRRFRQFVGEQLYNGAVARQSIGWLREAGWTVDVIPALGLNLGTGQGYELIFDEHVDEAVSAGALSPEEGAELRADIADRQKAGTFLSYSPNFRITAQKPR